MSAGWIVTIVVLGLIVVWALVVVAVSIKWRRGQAKQNEATLGSYWRPTPPSNPMPGRPIEWRNAPTMPPRPRDIPVPHPRPQPRNAYPPRSMRSNVVPAGRTPDDSIMAWNSAYDVAHLQATLQPAT